MQDDKEPLIVLTSSDAAPFSFYNKLGILTGFDIELIKAVEKKMDKSFTIKDTPFYLIMEYLRIFYNTKCDLAITAISETDERKKVMDLSIPYYISQSVLLIKNDKTIKSENDLKNKKIALRRGTVQESFAKSKWEKNNVKIHIFDSLSKNEIHGLIYGDIDAIFLDFEEAQNFVRKNNTLTYLPINNTDSNFCIALPKGSLLTNVINQIIKELKDDGTIDKLINKWFFSEHITNIQSQDF